MKLNRTAQPLWGTEASVEGWFYESPKSIEVYIRNRVTGELLKGRIRRSALEDWLKRTK